MPLTLQNVDLTATSPSNMTHGMSRSRRSSLSSVTSEASSLFPIYESGLNQNFLQVCGTTTLQLIMLCNVPLTHLHWLIYYQ